MNCPCCDHTEYKEIVLHKEFSKISIVECTNCGLFMAEPMPSRQMLSDSYKEEYRDDRGENINEEYLRVQNERAKNQFNFFQEFCNSGKILEIGCSVGSLLSIAQNHSLEVYGVEPDIQMSNHAQKALGPNVKTGLFEDVEFEKNYFDIVCLSNVFEHLTNPSEILSRTKEIKKGDGVLFM